MARLLDEVCRMQIVQGVDDVDRDIGALPGSFLVDHRHDHTYQQLCSCRCFTEPMW
jgi:hypothetical protein